MVFTDIQKHEMEARLIEFGKSHEEILALYLFGSFLTSDAPEDIDVALLLHPQPDNDIFKTRIRLSHSLCRYTAIDDIDLLLLQTADPIIRMQVLRHGKLLFSNDERYLQKFIIQTLGAYYDLKQVRKPIEQAILNGRIYA